MSGGAGRPACLHGVARPLRRVAAIAVLLGALASPAGAQPPAGPPGAARAAAHDRGRAFRVPDVPRPAYLTPFADPVFGTSIVRVSDDRGQPIPRIDGTWGEDARHAYSKQQPWSADGAYLLLQNRGGGARPSRLLLDGNSYRPLREVCPGADLYDYRWHPSRRHAHVLINVDRAGTGLSWIDVDDCARVRSWRLPIGVDYGIGSGEGNPSRDGRYVALGSKRAMFVVDMDPQPPYAAYPARRIGPVYTLPPCDDELGDDCKIDNLSISPSGRYIDVNYGRDMHRIFEVDPRTLAIRPHVMDRAAARCDPFTDRTDGWIFPLKHADMALDPFDRDEDVIVGGRSCPGAGRGHLAKVRLRDGQMTLLEDPANAAWVMHVSTRNLERPGWAYVSYEPAPGKRMGDEIVAVRLDGGAVERLAHKHSQSHGCYRCEPHPVPSPDGRRVLFASNWARDCGGGCGDDEDIKAYVVTAAAAQRAPSLPRTGPPPHRGTHPPRHRGAGRR